MKKIEKISEGKFRITTPQEPIIEEVSIKELEEKLIYLKQEKLDFEISHFGVFNKQKEISTEIEKLKIKIDEIKNE